MRDFDYIIVGKGIAGSILAQHLISKNQKILLYNHPTKAASSLVAGGMFNPVTGRHLGKTWLAETLFEYLFEYYKNLEKKTGTIFFHPIGIFRPFSNQENKNYFIKQIEKNQLYDYIDILENYPSQNLKAELGGLLTLKSGWVNVPALLKAIENELLKNQSEIYHEAFDYNKLEIRSQHIEYKSIKAKSIIFAEGFFAKDNPFFNWLPFNPVKGETLLCKAQNHKISHIINQNKWVMPITTDTLRIGATYSWHELDNQPTPKAKEELLAKTGEYLKFVPEVLEHQAGIRPSTRDRRPFVGSHPSIPHVYCFNGLGTKGVSLAPYFANQLSEFILEKKLIDPEANIQRFYTLFS